MEQLLEELDSGRIESYPSALLQPKDVQRAISDEARERRNEKRRLRYAKKHSKKAKLAELHSRKETLEKTVKQLTKELERYKKKRKH